MGGVHHYICVVCVGTRKYKAARDVLRKLPPDSVEVVKRNWRMRVKDMVNVCTSGPTYPFLPPSLLSLSLSLSLPPPPPPLSLFLQAGDAPLSMNTKNDLHEFHCIQAYLVSDNNYGSLRIEICS